VIAPTLSFADATRMWDAIVIGAGPAGAVTARQLARKGLKVLLIDRAQFPRSKVCGGCLNRRTLTVLDRIGLADLLKALKAEPIESVQLYCSRRSARLSLPAGLSISRNALDEALVREAIEEGVQFLPGMVARMGKIDGMSRLVSLHHSHKTASIPGRVVVVAQGLPQDATIAPGSRIGGGVLVDRVSPDFPLRSIGMAVARGGYVGMVRVEDDRLDVAAAFDVEQVRRHGGLGPAATAVLREAGAPEFPELSTAAWRGTPALTRRPRRIAGERWFAVGDAAGYVEPFTGEGIAWALTGAEALAPIAARPWDASLSAEWSEVHSRLIGSRQRLCWLIARSLRQPALCSAIVAGLNLLPQMAAPVVRRLNGVAR
jgi:flavin-dependent dehydrogenase